MWEFAQSEPGPVSAKEAVGSICENLDLQIQRLAIREPDHPQLCQTDESKTPQNLIAPGARIHDQNPTIVPGQKISERGGMRGSEALGASVFLQA